MDSMHTFDTKYFNKILHYNRDAMMKRVCRVCITFGDCEWSNGKIMCSNCINNPIAQPAPPVYEDQVKSIKIEKKSTTTANIAPNYVQVESYEESITKIRKLDEKLYPLNKSQNIILCNCGDRKFDKNGMCGCAIDVNCSCEINCDCENKVCIENDNFSHEFLN